MSDDLDAQKPMRLISFKAPEADHTLVARMAIGAKSLSAFMRQLIRNAAGQFGPSLPEAPPEPVRDFNPAPIAHRPPPDPELVRQLAKLGNLLNQIAKGMHLCRHNGSAVDLPKLHFILLMIDGHMDYLREQYSTVVDDDVVIAPAGDPT